MIKHGHIKASKEVIEKLNTISASSIDRILKDERKKLEIKGRKGTKQGTLLKNQIEIRTWFEWNENRPGFSEIDLEQHEGGNSNIYIEFCGYL